MERRRISKCDPRLSAARIRPKHRQEFHGWEAVPFQNVALVLAPRTLVFRLDISFKYSHG
eukprot:9487009-Pyramimonas_sp.AAC.1